MSKSRKSKNGGFSVGCAESHLDTRSRPGYLGVVSERSRKRLADRAEAMRPFLAMEIMEKAFAMERDGIDVAHLEIGEPAFDPPPAVLEACSEALQSGETRYTDSRGLEELRIAIVRDTERRFGVAVSPERVLVCNGTSPAMLLVFSALLSPGDEVLLATPHYPCTPNFIRFCGGEPILIPTCAEDDYQLRIDDVRAACTERTRAIVVCSPANPTGAIQDRSTLEQLASLGLPLVSDEIYDGLVYGDRRVTSGLEVSPDAFVLDGFSKRFAMTGFRLGYVIAPEWAMRSLQIMQQNLFISANRFVQRAGVAALEHAGEWVDEKRHFCEVRRDRLADGLRELGFVIPRLPDGAFYLFVDARRFGTDSLALAAEILEKAHVGVTPGIDFGEIGEGMLRFCYAVSEATIDSALVRLAEVLPAIADREAKTRARAVKK